MRYGWCGGIGVLGLACLVLQVAEARGRGQAQVGRRAAQGGQNQSGLGNSGGAPQNGQWSRNGNPNGGQWNQNPQWNQNYGRAQVAPPSYPVARTNVAPQSYPGYYQGTPYNYSQPSPPARPTTTYVAPQPAANPAVTSPAPTVKATVPTAAPVLALHQSAAVHLHAQARAATWDLYEHYDQSPGYKEAYREMYRLLGLTRSLADAARGQSPTAAASTQMIAWLHEAEVLLQVVQVQTANWSRDANAPESSSRADLQTQLERLSATLSEVMTAYRIPPQEFAAAEEEPATVIRARQ